MGFINFCLFRVPESVLLIIVGAFSGAIINHVDVCYDQVDFLLTAVRGVIGPGETLDRVSFWDLWRRHTPGHSILGTPTTASGSPVNLPVVKKNPGILSEIFF